VFENRVLRGIFGSKGDEVTGERRKLHNGELQNRADQIKENEMGGTCGTNGRGEKRVQSLVRKPEGKRPLGRPRRRWDDGIRMDLEEIGWGVWSGFTWLSIGTVGGLL
jgi:hypothetical protein